MNSENTRQGSVARILQGRQADPKESNALLNPILERPPEAESGLKLARIAEAPPINEELKKVREESGIQRREPTVKQEPVIKRDEPGVKREERGSIDGYGLNSVKVHDSLSQSSKGPSKKAASKIIRLLVGTRTAGSTRLGQGKKKPVSKHSTVKDKNSFQ